MSSNVNDTKGSAFLIIGHAVVKYGTTHMHAYIFNEKTACTESVIADYLILK